MNRFVVLNDGETFTGLDGCKIVQHPTEGCPDDDLIKELFQAESAIPIQRPEDKEVQLFIRIVDEEGLSQEEAEEAIKHTDNEYYLMIPVGLSEEMVGLIARGVLFKEGWESFNTYSAWGIIVKQ